VQAAGIGRRAACHRQPAGRCGRIDRGGRSRRRAAAALLAAVLFIPAFGLTATALILSALQALSVALVSRVPRNA
jgi:hypothetical protein